MSFPSPSPSCAIKLASLAVHTQELLSSDGHDFDRLAIETLLNDPEVCAYIAELDTLALVPKRRQ